MRTLLALFSASLCCAQTIAPNDRALTPFFQKANPNQTFYKFLLREPVTSSEDLVVALSSSSRTGGDPYQGNQWWGPGATLGLFLQRRSGPPRTVVLALVPGPTGDEGFIQVQRVTSTELVLARYPEKGLRPDTLKFFFDPVARKLIKRIQYPPLPVRRVVTRGGVPYFIAQNSTSAVAIRPAGDSFQIDAGLDVPPPVFRPVRVGRFTLSEVADPSWGKRKVLVETASGKPLTLPQDAPDDIPNLRPDVLRSGWRPASGSIQEDIGPYQLAGGRLWFGKTFYDGEGMTGVGAFGYFDPAPGRYVLFSPLQVRPWSVSAILVEPDAVWLGLKHRGEYGDSSGGLLRWDRAGGHVATYRCPSVINAIARFDGRLYLGTCDGVALLQDGRIRQFFVDYGLDGKPRVVEARQQP